MRNYEKHILQEPSTGMFQFQQSSLQIEFELWQLQNQQPWQPELKDLGLNVANAKYSFAIFLFFSILVFFPKS